jgi:NAD(P)H-nitrite reductase large subunit
MKKSELSNLKVSNPEKIICYCMHVTQNEIESAIQSGAKTLSDVQEITGACTGNQCKEVNPSGKCCSEDIHRLFKMKVISSSNQSDCCKKN